MRTETVNGTFGIRKARSDFVVFPINTTEIACRLLLAVLASEPESGIPPPI
jgi:hypothetical protein